MNLDHIKKLMQRKRTTRSGENGKVLVVGGSEDTVGMAVLTCLGALRAGCDRVTLAAPHKVAWAAHKYSPDIVTKKLKGNFISQRHSLELVRFAQAFDCVVIGNGIGIKESTKKFVHKFIRHTKKPLVIDSDALKIVSLKEVKNSIITPQFSELIELLKKVDKTFLIERLTNNHMSAKDLALTLQANLKYFLENNNILILKGPVDIIISRNKICLNRTGNPGMSKAGSGNVLAGLCAGFLAKTQDLFKSACAGAFINGEFGDIQLKKKKGFSFIASDLIEDLSKIKKKKK